MPGLVELHTDHIEAHYVPRPKVYWDPVAAVVSYDGMLATCGITTVMDSLRVWRDEAEGDIMLMANILADAIAKARCANLLAPAEPFSQPFLRKVWDFRGALIGAKPSPQHARRHTATNS